MSELVNTCAEREELGGGRFRHTQHLREVAYNDKGTLRRIAPTWANSGISARPHIVTASRMMVSVGNDGLRRIHPTREVDRYIEIGTPYVKVAGVWRKVGFTSATRTANSITWHRPQADLRITHGGHFVKLDLELLGGYVPEQNLVAFPVGLQGLTRKGGNILADGETVALLRAPVVTDADNAEDVRPIAYEFANVGGQPYIVMTLPSLTGMVRPVVDPTLTLQPDAAGGKDTGVAPGTQSARNFGVSTSLGLGLTGTKPLIEFDCSSVPAAATCSSAILYFYHAAQSTNSPWTAAWYSIASGNAAWIEGTKNNATAGAGEPCWDALAADGAGGVTTAWAGSAGLSTSGTDYEAVSLGSCSGNRSDAVGTEYTVSLTAARVRGWFGAINTNYGIMVGSGFANDAGYMCSSDHATAGYRPKLVVVYTVPAGMNVFAEQMRAMME